MADETGIMVEAARGHESFGAFIDETCLDQGVGDGLLEVVGGGLQLFVDGGVAWTIEGGGAVQAIDQRVPGDVSAAAFWLVALALSVGLYLYIRLATSHRRGGMVPSA